MTTQIARNLSVALFAAATLVAQGSQPLTVQVPFGFHVGNSVLPAGGYTVYTEGPSHILRLRSDDSKSAAMIQSIGVQKLNAPRQGMLIFNKYGDEYFLSQVWAAGVNTGRELVKTKREFEVAAIARRGIESVVARK